MRVVLLSHEYPPFIYGGIGTFVKNLSEGLSGIGVEVTVLSGYPSSRALFRQKVEETKYRDNLSVFRFPFPDTSPRQLWFQLINLRRLYEVAKGIDPDVFHGQCGSTFPASLTLKNLAPMLVTFHHSPKVELMMSLLSLRRGGSLGDIKIYGIGYPTYSLTYRSELKSTRISVAVSNSLRSELLDEMGWKYQEKLREIHNGVNLKQLDSEYGLVRDELHESANNVLFAGRFFWRKGAMEIIKIAHLMKRNNLNSKIIVHGDGPLFGKMKHTIEKLGLTNIDLRGFTTRFQLMQSLKRSKFVLIPSFYEACPIILLESMCLGKIPLMYSLPYSLEFTDHGKYGILAKGADDLVRKFSNLDEGDLDTMSSATKNFARKKYDVHDTALQYIKLYKEICSEPTN